MSQWHLAFLGMAAILFLLDFAVGIFGSPPANPPYPWWSRFTPLGLFFLTLSFVP